MIVEEFKQRSFYNYSLSPGTEGGSEHTITSPQADAELVLLLVSPASLRDTLAARYDALLNEIERAINSGEAFKYEYTDPKQAGRAIPPQEAPLTPEEGRAELEKARTRLGEKKRVVEENAQIFRQRLTEVIGQCGW